jgi:hypothetical protein
MNVKLEALRAIIGNKQILVYGAGNQGRGTRQALSDQGFEPSGFIDKNPQWQNRLLAGLPVHPPEYIMRQDASDAFFVVVASFFFEREMAKELESWGFARNSGYMSYSALKPHDYVVEVSGSCNLHCLSCPRAASRSSRRPSAMMSIANFKKVLAKIRREDPFVANIQLYQWGEPTLNRDLPEMIRYAKDNGFLCGLSSNLNHQADFRALVETHPECLRISASGTGDAYELTHTGGDWNTFAANAETISRLRREIYPEMKVELYYHRYQHSIGKAQDHVAGLCHKLGFEFHPVPAYLISLDDVLAYCEGRPLPDSAKRARELLLIDLDKGLKLASQEASLKCDAFRVMMINADLTVSTCMMYYDPAGNTIAANFLETPLEELVARRSKTTLCTKCKKYGIHRYCGVYAKIGEEERY